MITVTNAKIPPSIREKRPWKSSSKWARRFAGYLHDRLWEQNRNFIVVFVGETGSGKSYSALAMAEMIDPNFSIEKVVFDPLEFLKLIDKTKRGDVIIFDEAGVGIPAREWQSIQNKLMGYVLQTFRYKNIGVFFTVPSMNFIDKQVKILCHHVIKVLGHNEHEQNMCVVYAKEHDPVRDITEWQKWIIREEESGMEIDPNPIFVGKPSRELEEIYEQKSQERKRKVYLEAEETLKALKEGVKAEGFDGRTVRKLINISKAFRNACNLLKEEFGLSERQVALKLGVNQASLRNWLAWIDANAKLYE